MTSTGTEAEKPQIRSYTGHLRADWWLHNRRYLLYMLRDFSPVPFTVWLLWWLVEINRLKSGAGAYHAHMSEAFIVFSAVCLLFALLHTVTFLNLSGVVLSLPLGTFRPSPALVRALNYGTWIVLSALVGAGTIYLAGLS